MIPIVIENLLPPELQEQVKEDVKWSGIWHFTDSTAGDAVRDPNDLCIIDTPQMVIKMIDKDKPASELAHVGFTVCESLENALDIKVLSFLRVKANLLFKDSGALGKYHVPHIDSTKYNILSLVYYVEDSDGDTIIFDKNVDEEPINMMPIYNVSPKQGYAVIFPSRQFHASSMPTEHPTRLILNFVLEIRPEDYQKLFYQNS